MEFAFRVVDNGVAGVLLKAILTSLLGIAMLIAFIVLRRWYRGRYFRRLNERMFVLRSKWEDLVAGRIPAESWRLTRFDSQIVESILLDSIEMASAAELPALVNCLRSSGLLDMRIYEARHSHGWKRRTALVALGRTRAGQAIPALVEALDSRSAQTRIAAVRGLGQIGLPEAAVPMLDRFASDRLRVPEHTLKNALAGCCRNSPRVLMQYLHHATGHKRELLARVLAEVASPDLGDELLTLATDELPEVRASAARALGNVPESFGLWALGRLVEDPEWFVRLRAVVALGAVKGHGRIRFLLRGLCDSNRFVRQRAAWTLARIEPNLEDILQQVVDTHDDYALQALISELERSGAMENVISALKGEADHDSLRATLVSAVMAGREGVEGARAKAAGAAAGGAQ